MMALFWSAVKENRRRIAVFLAFCGIFSLSFALYGLPMGAVLYPAALCAAAGAAMFALSGGKKAEYCSLGEYHGRVAIFAPDERTLPRQITAIAVHTLPSADRAALSGGIAVYSREELYARLEDFGS